MEPKKGARVGAILCADEEGGKKVLKFLGYGVYEGDEVPPPGHGFMQDATHEMGLTNPKITLDSGKVVWGCQCWWGSEASVKKQVKGYEENGYKIVTVDIDEEARLDEIKQKSGLN